MSDKLPEPITTKEKFLAKSAGMDVKTPKPVTREEIYLNAIAENGDSGGSGSVNAYTKSETDALLEDKVDKEPGKQLSEENYTAEDKEKLNGLANYDDTDIQTDISAVKEQTALNLSSIGIQRKNLLKNLGKTGTFSGVTFSIDDAGRISASGTLTSQLTYFINDTSMIFDRDVIVSRSGTLTNLNLYVRIRESGAGSNEYIQVTESGLLIPAGTAVTQVYLQRQATGLEVTVNSLGVMIRYAEIADDTYEPYVDDLQTQINQLTARIAALENGNPMISSNTKNNENPSIADENESEVLYDERTDDMEQADFSRDDESRSVGDDGESLCGVGSESEKSTE